MLAFTPTSSASKLMILLKMYPFMSIKQSISIILTLSYCLFVNPADYSDTGRDTILQGQQPLRDWESLISANGVFRLQFFSRQNSDGRYLGIFRNFYESDRPVWVANRNDPIEDSSGSIMIDTHGNLKITSSVGDVPSVFSSAPVAARNASATLLDDGNFALRGINGTILWQSFDYPTDTLQPGMKLGINFRTGHRWSLTSWRTDDLPADGSFTIGGDPNGTSQLVIWWLGNVYKTSGLWINGYFANSNSTSRLSSSDDYGSFSYISNENEKYLIYSGNDAYSGTNFRIGWDGKVTNETGESPDFLNFSCYNNDCEEKKTLPECRKDDNDFINMTNYFMHFGYLPDGSNYMSHFDCREKCKQNCSCIAFASTYQDGTGCQIWSNATGYYPYNTSTTGDFYLLKEILEKSKSSGPAAELAAGPAAELAAGPHKHKWWVWLITALSGTILLAYLVLCRPKPEKVKQRPLQELEDAIILPDKCNKTSDEIDKKMTQVQFLSFESIAMATNNFSTENKLGEGGFGPVYKGKLPSGKAIAIKRLSRSSGQGLTEFKNEILLIAKVQHTNLVKLLGCCIEREEKILVYEYMPNKSLDYFLFDHSRRELLNWTNRLDIINGVAQGLVYLHEYSRLKVIHRDLKAGNILLDENMNPKISDFGLARIFGAQQSEANTNRIVGTYGYMSPEYAGKGIVSLKTDVFSFGVLVLEIMSGKKNYNSYDSEHALNLIGFAWELWMKGRIIEVMDSTLDNLSHRDQMVRCINVGLLCVQDNAADRPSMKDVVSMLTIDSVRIPAPKQPAFYIETRARETQKEISSEKSCTNGLTISVMVAR